MQIELTRRAVTRWGADGTLTLEGRPFCDTVEHPDRLLPKGTYPVRLVLDRRFARTMPTLPGGAIIRPSNGPFTLRNGSIAVGRHRLSGLLVDTADCFDHLVRRIRRCLARGEPVTLTIR